MVAAAVVVVVHAPCTWWGKMPQCTWTPHLMASHCLVWSKLISSAGYRLEGGSKCHVIPLPFTPSAMLVWLLERDYPELKRVLSNAGYCALCGQPFLHSWLQCVQFLPVKEVSQWLSRGTMSLNSFSLPPLPPSPSRSFQPSGVSPPAHISP